MLILGWSIYLDSRWLLRHLLRRIHSRVIRNHRLRVGLWFWKFPRWPWIYARKTAERVLENVLVHHHTVYPHNNIFLYRRNTVTSDLRKFAISLDGPCSRNSRPHLWRQSDSTLGIRRFYKKSALTLERNVDASVLAVTRLGTAR